MIDISENTNDNQHKHTNISLFHVDVGKFVGWRLPLPRWKTWIRPGIELPSLSTVKTSIRNVSDRNAQDTLTLFSRIDYAARILFFTDMKNNGSVDHKVSGR